jgi:hypothetical protein
MQDLNLYVTGGFTSHTALLRKLGKHSLGKGCLYLKSLEEVHLPSLKKLIRQSLKDGPKNQQRTQEGPIGAANNSVEPAPLRFGISDRPASVRQLDACLARQPGVE